MLAQACTPAAHPSQLAPETDFVKRELLLHWLDGPSRLAVLLCLLRQLQLILQQSLQEDRAQGQVLHEQGQLESAVTAHEACCNDEAMTRLSRLHPFTSPACSNTVTEPSLIADEVLQQAESQQAPSSCGWWLLPFHLPLTVPWGTLCVEVSPAYLNYSRMGCRSVGKSMALPALMSVFLGLGAV